MFDLGLLPVKFISSGRSHQTIIITSVVFTILKVIDKSTSCNVVFTILKVIDMFIFLHRRFYHFKVNKHDPLSHFKGNRHVYSLA